MHYTPRQRSSVTLIYMKTSLHNQTDASAKRNIQLPPPVGLYVFKVYFDDGPDNMTSIFRKATWCVKILICVMSSPLLTGARLLDTGAGPN